MKNIKSAVCTLFAALCLATGCVDKKSTSETKQSDTIVLTFIQHSFINFSFDESGNGNGYFFMDDELAVTTKEYERDYYLTLKEIENIKAASLHYVVPKLSGDGYWSFTQFVVDFNKETGFATNFLKSSILSDNLTVHFAIYG